MVQAMQIAMKGGGIPAGASVEQTFIAGEQSVPAVKIGPDENRGYDERLSSIASRLGKLAQEQVVAKSEIEQRWIRNVRAFHGIYDQTIEKSLKDAGQSRAYVKATRSKTVTLEARLFDLIFPTDDKNWGIEATPVPKLSKEGKEATLRATNAAAQANEAEAQGNHDQAQQMVTEGSDEAARALAAIGEIKKARDAADAMQEEMDDQLIETHYPAESRRMIGDGCLLGTGILKGPMVRQQARGKWLPAQPDQTNADAPTQWELKATEDPRPLIKRTDPWAFFPDMSASTIEEAEFTFERYLWTKSDLRKMVKTHGFDADAVRELLRDNRGKPKNVTDSSINYLVQLRSLTGETTTGIRNRFVGWEYHGPLECDDLSTLLLAMGQEDAAKAYEDRDDPLEEFRVVIHFCENTILKIAEEYPLDSGETLYSVFNVEEVEGSIFGYGIPEIISDSAVALNSAWRMGLDNAALSVGPQAMIDKDQIAPADGSWQMFPKKVWLRIKAGVQGSQQPIEFFNVPNNMNEIEKIIKIALEFIDIESGLPMPQQGEQGAHTQTVGGMTILQNASNIIFRRMVKNYDDGIIAPTMRRLYDWNMQFSKRSEIKGDMSVDARGTSVLLLKEVQAQNLMFIVTQLLSSPAVQPMLKPYQNVMKLFQSMMISPLDVMVTEDEYKENMKKMAEQPPAPNPAEITAKARIDAATIMAKASIDRGQLQLEIEQIKSQIAQMGLAQSEGISLKEVQAQLDMKQMDSQTALQRQEADGQSKERIKAVEIAVEDKRARDAEAAGIPESTAVGKGIG